MAEAQTRTRTVNPWNADPVNRGWALWRALVDADDLREAVAALKRDELRCIVLAQLLERRAGTDMGAPDAEAMASGVSRRSRARANLRLVGE